jgi:hypothetical protein
VVRTYGEEESKGRKAELTLQEELENASDLLIDQPRCSFNASSSSETSDIGLSDTLAVRGKMTKESAWAGSPSDQAEGGREEEKRACYLAEVPVSLAPPFSSPFPPAASNEEEGASVIIVSEEGWCTARARANLSLVRTL